MRRSSKAKCFASHARFILLTSEGGSIRLRTEGEGGQMYGHHGSKAAANVRRLATPALRHVNTNHGR